MPKSNLSTSFYVYQHKLVIKGQYIKRPLIAIRDSDGLLYFTDFHKYCTSPATIRNIASSDESRIYAVVPLLNFAFFIKGIKKLDDLTVDIVQEYLTAYGLCNLPWDDDNTRRKETTVQKTVAYILDFLNSFIDDRKGHCRMKKNDLFQYKHYRNKRGQVRKRKVPTFEIRFLDSPADTIFRDIPNRAFLLLFNHIRVAHKEMLGVVMLQAFAGLRPSEACNVRREDSPIGPGIIFTRVGHDVRRIQIDLTAERVLRSDLVFVGGIKKERMAEVPDIFISAFIDAYEDYLHYLISVPYEKAYAPFSVNTRGLALTYDSYYQMFKKIIKTEMIPIYLADDDAETVIYGRMLLEHNLAPHVFRHWFTVQLILSGVNDIGTLMFYRGDKSPQSALTYIEGKGELEKRYRRVAEGTFDYLKWASEKVVNNDN